MSRDYDSELICLINNEGWLINAFKIVRELALPDWFIAAGAIRNTVWNYLHGYTTQSHQRDIDVIYYDISDMEGDKERSSEGILKIKSPDLIWEVTNQARAHLFKENLNSHLQQVSSSCESLRYWSETATCVGVRLEKDDSLTICAPYGLDDLFNLVVRPIPEPFRDLNLYHSRIKEKQWEKQWPGLKIIY